MVDPAVANGLRRREIDVLTTQEGEQLSFSDEDQLALAVREGRVLFTMDEDFLVMAAQSQEHCGIAFLAQRNYTIGRAVNGMVRLWENRTPESMQGQVEYL